MRSLTIGQLAKATQVGVETVRYYEKRGLLPEPPRRESGYRQFPVDAIKRIRFIKRAQNLGFSLREISQLLALSDGQQAGCEEVRHFALEKVREIETRIDHFMRLKQILLDLVTKCKGKGPLTDCPIIESLTEDLKKGDR
jgi:MerR family mercuric resistance operon transcriptional regulator